MSQSRNLSREINVFQEWMKEMEKKPEIHSAEEAYAAVRAVIQTIRDRLPISEAAQFSAQLPAIARGIFFEGWKPTNTPEQYNLQEFYDRVRHRLNGNCADANPAILSRHVFEILDEHMGDGQMRHLQNSLPREFQPLMAEQARA